MNAPVLTERERKVLFDVLRPYADHIEKVGLFGSRATGTATPVSDIDLVLYGDLDAAQERRLFTHFQESNLSVPVDVVVYARIKHEPLKRHIDLVMKTIFEQKDLKRLVAPT